MFASLKFNATGRAGCQGKPESSLFSFDEINDLLSPPESQLYF